MPDVLHLDFETRGVLDLPDVGVHRYATHPQTDVWLACWAIGDGPIHTWFPKDPCPREIADHIAAGGVVCAHNAGFEWHIVEYICAERYGWPRIDPTQLDCTAARGAIMALPRDLGRLAKALGLPAEKDDAGRRLMLQMARPRRVEDGVPIWWDDPKKLQRLEDYCRRDLEVERLAGKKLAPMTPAEREIWLLDFDMNQTGVGVDLRLVKRAGLLLERSLSLYNQELLRITNGAVSAVTEVAAITNWLAANGAATESLDKVHVREMLSRDHLPDNVRRVLEIRQEAGKSSTAKLLAFAHRTSADGVMRENLMYHGASTGRWAGRGVQLQNLPRPELKKKAVSEVIALVRDADLTALDALRQRLEMFYGPVPSIIADTLRGCVIPPAGYVLYASDFANIEGRVLAWLAGQDDLVDMFANGGKVYEAMAAAIYRMEIDLIGKESRERQLGKKAVLGCGYGMGWQKFQKSCADDGIYIDEELARRVVDTYREVNDKIVEFWYGIEGAAISAVSRPGFVTEFRGIKFLSRDGWLRCRLLSGRDLWYCDPKIEDARTPWGKTKRQLSFMGVDPITKQWCRQRTYGGALTENIVQALARDLLAGAMLRINSRFKPGGMKVVLSVHDEIIAKAPTGCPVTVAEFEGAMQETPAWAAGCPVEAAGGYIAERYRK